MPNTSRRFIIVDKNLLVGHPKVIDATIEELRKEGSTLTVEDEFNDYYYCIIKFSKDRKKALLLQPHVVSNVEKNFGEESKSKRTYLTPGLSGTIMVPFKNEKV